MRAKFFIFSRTMEIPRSSEAFNSRTRVFTNSGLSVNNSHDTVLIPKEFLAESKNGGRLSRPRRPIKQHMAQLLINLATKSGVLGGTFDELSVLVRTATACSCALTSSSFLGRLQA